jgi:hypothetical protein
MTYDEFAATLDGAAPPPALRGALVALWHDAKGNWTRAHEVAQEIENVSGSWVHAYLHRKEGDESNAAYWYRRAGKPVEHGPLEAEWKAIVTALLGNKTDPA